MSKFALLTRTGHWPTLLAAFLYFDFCFAIWVLNGAMAPFISESFQLGPAQRGFMISVPILAGALMRLPLGLLSQYIGRKNAAMLEMGLIVAALVFGCVFVDRYDRVLAMGVLLGIAGASFGVAMSLGSGWYPAHLKGLAMGVAGAGNAGTVLAVLFAPPLAQALGWQAVYGLAAVTMLLPMAVMWMAAKEPPDVAPQRLRQHAACLFERDGWAFSLIYLVTFGGFIGLAAFLPTYYHDQFQVTKVQAGQLTVLATLMGSVVRVAGGALSDRIGGVNTLTGVLVIAAFSLVGCGVAGQSLVGSTLLLMLCFAAFGAGNGALFQLVPLRWPMATAVASSMIGEVGALGGGLIPNAMGQSLQRTGSYLGGFLAFATLAILMLGVLRMAQIRWTRTWAEQGGRAEVPRAAPGRAEATEANRSTQDGARRLGLVRAHPLR